MVRKNRGQEAIPGKIINARFRGFQRSRRPCRACVAPLLPPTPGRIPRRLRCRRQPKHCLISPALTARAAPRGAQLEIQFQRLRDASRELRRRCPLLRPSGLAGPFSLYHSGSARFPAGLRFERSPSGTEGQALRVTHCMRLGTILTLQFFVAIF